ncbi:MAG: molybdopterin cofactor-binding domain-containing protein, partial [Gammaproteobacteria bacterium]
MDELSVEWDEGPNSNVSSETIAEMMREGLSADTPYIGNQAGNAREVLEGASSVIEADYSYPFQHHAPMEPLAATVLCSDEGCEMWAPTQRPEAALATMAEASGHPLEACEIHTMRIGGSFGRRLATDYVEIATLIAKQLPGTPIKTMWTREEDMLHGRYHPATQARFRAALNDQGEVEALHVRISGQSITSYTFPSTITEDRGDPVAYQGLEAEGDMAISYTFPNLLVDHSIRNTHIRPGYWRGVNLNQNALYMESFIDELAHETGEDPVAFRRKLMRNHPKNLAVLNTVVEGIGWDTPAPEGIYRGVAQVKGFG